MIRYNYIGCNYNITITLLVCITAILLPTWKKDIVIHLLNYLLRYLNKSRINECFWNESITQYFVTWPIIKKCPFWHMLFIFREVGAVVLTGCSLPTVSIRATAGTVHTVSFEYFLFRIAWPMHNTFEKIFFFRFCTKKIRFTKVANKSIPICNVRFEPNLHPNQAILQIGLFDCL